MKANSRKKEIQQAFIEYYIYRDLSHISVREICEKINMSRTSFYHYYDSLEHVLDSIKTKLIEQLLSYNKNFYKLDFQNLSEETYESVLPTLNFIEEYSMYFKALLAHRVDDDFYMQWSHSIQKDFLKKYQAYGATQENIQVRLQLTSAAIIGLYEYWLYNLDSVSKHDVISGINDTLCGVFRK